MKKIIKLFITFIMINTSILYLKADCVSDKELVKDSTAVIFEEFTGESVNLEVILYGVNENMYIKVYNDFSNETNTYGRENYIDETMSFSTDNVNKDINYKIDIYSSNCPSEVIRTINLYNKKVNPYANSDVCVLNYMYTDLCGKYSDVSNLSMEEFNKKVESQARKAKLLLSIQNGIINNYMYIVVPMLVISLYYAIRIMLVKRKKKMEGRL